MTPPTTAALASGAQAAANEPRDVDPDAVLAFVNRVSGLIREAARCMGVSEASAVRIGDQHLMTVNRMLVTLLPMPANAEGLPGVLVTVLTERTIGADAATSRLLQHGADLLATYDAALGSSPAGCWTLVRWLPLGGLTAQRLAEEVALARQLVDIVWGTARA